MGIEPDQLDAYLQTVSALAEEKEGSDPIEQIWDFVDRKLDEHPHLWKHVDFRKSLITPDEADRYLGLLATGIVSFELPENRRFALLMFQIDIQTEMEDRRRKQRCEPYSQEQPLFTEFPDLWNRIRKTDRGTPDFELIDISGMSIHPESQYLRVTGDLHAEIDSHLPPSVVDFARLHYPKAPVHVRLNPYSIVTSGPFSSINEELIRPLTATFWQGLNLYSGQDDGFEFLLQRVELSKANAHRFIEYERHGHRKLEGFYRRKNEKYVSLMIEEVGWEDEQREILRGLMIHADMHAPRGTPHEEAVLKHIDLAVNYYLGQNARVRMDQSLSDGRVEDATMRMHLFRTEAVTLSSLPGFMILFFKSRCLLAEFLCQYRKVQQRGGHNA